MKAYFTLAIQWNKGENFSPEFGDFDIDCVKDERDDVLGSYYDLKPNQLKIIKTCGTQSAIDQAIHQLNSTLKGIK